MAGEARGEAGRDRRRRKHKSMFPVTGSMENRGKDAQVSDCLNLAKLVSGKYKLAPSEFSCHDLMTSYSFGNLWLA